MNQHSKVNFAPEKPSPIAIPRKRCRRFTGCDRTIKRISIGNELKAVSHEHIDICKPKIHKISASASTPNLPNMKIIKIPMTEKRSIRIILRFVKRVVVQIRLNNDLKRRSIFRELIETERNYVDSLMICNEVYYKPLDRSILTKSPLIESSSIGKLFGNIDEICNAHKNCILNVINEQLPLLKRPFPPHSVYLKIFDTFIEILPKLLSLYTQYLKTQEGSDAVLEKLKKKNKKFTKFLQEALFNPRAKCQEIEDLLILPTQRIAGYKLLFERLKKYFPEETYKQESKSLNDVLNLILNIGITLNEEKSDQKSQSQLLSVAETVNKVPSFMCILKPGRKYIHSFHGRFIDPDSGELLGHIKIFVMNDIVLFAKRNKGKMFSKLFYIDAVPFMQIRLSAFPLISFIDSSLVFNTDTHIYNINLKNSSRQTKFISVIRKQKKQIMEQVKKQTLDGIDYMQNIFQKLSDLYTNPKPLKSRGEKLEFLENNI